MSIINYEKLYKTTDARIVRTKQAFFKAILQILPHKDATQITVTELCSTAKINRKTFYVHYSSVADLLDDFEDQIVSGFFDKLAKSDVLSSQSFDAYGYVMLLDKLVEENIDDFNIVFPFLKSGVFLRKIGAEMGKLAFHFIEERPGYFDSQVYPFSLVFTLCGLITSYIDWIDFGRNFPITELAEISRTAVTTPLSAILNPGEQII